MAEMDMAIRVRLIDQASRQMKAVQRQMDAMRRAQRASQTVAATTRAQRATASAVSARQATANAVSARAGAAGGAMMGADRALMAYAARVAGPAAIGAGLYKATQAAVDFETAMAEVQKFVGGTAEQLPALREEILALSKDMGISAEKIAEAYARAGQFGIERPKMRDFVRDAAKVAIGFEMDEGEAATALAKLGNILQVPHDQIMNLADAINHLADAGAASETGVVSFMREAAGSARQFGLAAEETAAFGAAFEGLGLEPAKAGNFFGFMLNQLAASDALQPKQQKAMARLGLNAKAFGEAVEEDALPALLDFLKALNDSPTKDRDILDFFGREWSSEAKLAIGSLEDIYKALQLVSDPANYRGGLDRTVAVMMATTRKQLDRMKANFRAFAINFGDMLLPGVNAGIDRILAQFERLETVGTPFEHWGQAAEGFARGLGFEDFSAMLSDINERLRGIKATTGDMGGDELGQTFQRWREAGEIAAEGFRKVEIALRRVVQMKIAVEAGAAIGKNFTWDPIAALGEGLFSDASIVEAMESRDEETRKRIAELRERYQGNQAEIERLQRGEPVPERAAVEVPRSFDEGEVSQNARREFARGFASGLPEHPSGLDHPAAAEGPFDHHSGLPRPRPADLSAQPASQDAIPALPPVPVEPVVSAPLPPLEEPVFQRVEFVADEASYADLQTAINARALEVQVQLEFDRRALLESDAAHAANVLGPQIPTDLTMPALRPNLPPETLSFELTLDTGPFRAEADGVQSMIVGMVLDITAAAHLDASGFEAAAGQILQKKGEVGDPVAIPISAPGAAGVISQLDTIIDRANAARRAAASVGSVPAGRGQLATGNRGRTMPKAGSPESGAEGGRK
jgi:TP901 family phage tail tape measure protein